ncbi:hypothetical protein BKA61DRAFT_653737 [Leptodontidium sp. MPI-SDFR-AT-0119]|nr:hypothetical protein BKA61DRAFT_653737 [Leptodontidium sp. MPI-SDFR-AT-0119]
MGRPKHNPGINEAEHPTILNDVSQTRDHPTSRDTKRDRSAGILSIDDRFSILINESGKKEVEQRLASVVKEQHIFLHQLSFVQDKQHHPLLYVNQIPISLTFPDFFFDSDYDGPLIPRQLTDTTTPSKPSDGQHRTKSKKRALEGDSRLETSKKPRTRVIKEAEWTKSWTDIYIGKQSGTTKRKNHALLVSSYERRDEPEGNPDRMLDVSIPP